MKNLNDGKQMRNMWAIPSTPTSEKKFGKYPAQKPIEVIKRLLFACTNEGDWVLDPFMGSGTIPLVCAKHRRKFVGIDNNPQAIKLAVKRIGNV